MATTPEQVRDDEAEFAAAFSEETPQAVEPSEDEAFGLTDEVNVEPTEDAGDEAEGTPAAVAIVVDGEAMAEEAQKDAAKDSAQAQAEMANDGEAAAVVEQEESPAGDMDMAKEIQRLKSWEGRLKALEAKLKATGASEEEQAEMIGESIEQAAEETDTPAEEEQVEQIAEQVEEGTLTPEQAMKQLAEDFGDEFVRMIEAIATAKAREAGTAAVEEKVGQLKGTVDEIIADISDTKARSHFETIADAHPDFQEIGDSEEFKTFIESLADDKKAQALDTIAGGSAKQVVKLLGEFKAANTRGGDAAPDLTEAKASIVDEATEDAMDAAEGVRSSGMKLPDEPSKAEDYEAAWNEF